MRAHQRSEEMSVKEEKKDRESFREKLYKNLDIEPDILPGGSTIELRGRNSMTVRGCGKILEYTPESIRLGLGDGELSICGARLICTSYRAGAVGIEGRIDNISFKEDGE